MLVFVAYVMYQEDQRAQLAVEAEQLEQLERLENEGQDSLQFEKPSQSAESRSREIADRPFEAGTPETGSAPVVPIVPEARQIPLKVVTIENDNIVAEISNGPGLIKSWRLLDFEEYVTGGAVPIELIHGDHPVLRTAVRGVSGETFSNARFEVVSLSEREVVQRARSSVGVLTRIFRLDESGYGFDLDVTFESHRSDPVDAGFEFSWPTEVSDREDFRELSLLAYGEEGGVTRTLVQGVGKAGMFGFGGGVDGVETVEGRSSWAGFDVQYFTGVVIDPDDRERLNVRFEALEAGESAEATITLPSVSIGPGGSVSDSLRGFLGPKTADALADAGSGLKHSVNRGFSWLEPLTRFFEISLDKLYGVIPNYGLAIIVLTILVRLCTAPLMAKQMRSAERMRALQPRMKELQERYKDDRQKQSEETMKLYREEKVNPIAGCLPLLLQFPVLIGLFYALRSSIGLRHAPFALWVTDLSQPATLFVMPGIDFPIRLLPLIMGASMFVQQKMTPTTGMDPTQAKMMLIMMPAMMLFISYTFPSGLVLYWTVSNLLGIAQQYWIRSKTQPAS
jgi:YidC/Oxa1 family membrane protein insertase